ncbi:MAG: hypothetical protein PPP58_05875 [Natronomonas sp.]
MGKRGGDVTDESRAWQLSKHLLEAQAQTTAAFEDHLLISHLESGSRAKMETAIEQAIDRHERIIEELEAVRQEIDGDEGGATDELK